MKFRPIGLRRKHCVPPNYRPVNGDLVVTFLHLLSEVEQGGSRGVYETQKQRLIAVHGVIEVERCERIALAMSEGRYCLDEPEAMQ